MIKLSDKEKAIYKKYWRYRNIKIPANILSIGRDAILVGVYFEPDLKLLVCETTLMGGLSQESIMRLRIALFGKNNKSGRFYGQTINDCVIKYLKSQKS